MSMEFEEGSLVDFYHVGTIDHKGQWYFFFQPSEPTGDIDPAELVVFRVEREGKDETLFPVKDEETLSELYDVFLKESGDADEPKPCKNCSRCGGCDKAEEKRTDN